MSTWVQQSILPKVEPSSAPPKERAVLQHSLLCVLSCHTLPSECTFGSTMLALPLTSQVGYYTIVWPYWDKVGLEYGSHQRPTWWTNDCIEVAYRDKYGRLLTCAGKTHIYSCTTYFCLIEQWRELQLCSHRSLYSLSSLLSLSFIPTPSSLLDNRLRI